MSYSGLIVLANNIDKVAENLYVGGNPTEDEAADFRFIVAMNHAPKYYIQDQTCVYVCPIKDDMYLPDRTILKRAAKIAGEFAELGPTLIHCTAGLNRSAMIAGMVLINRGMCPQEAIDLIREKRGSDALDNEFFRAWLYHYGDECGTIKF